MSSCCAQAEPQAFLLNYGFNQDGSCFSLATSTGFRTFTLAPLAEISRRNVVTASGEALNGGGAAVALAVMLFQTNYLALVLKSQPYKVLLWDDSLRQKPHEIWSRYEILAVSLRRDVLVVVSEYRIYIYEFGSFQVLMHVETCTNPKGLAALSPGSVPGTGSGWVFVCPGNSAGAIKIQTGADQSAEIAAHNHNLAALAINQDGSIVASASEQGTVIKVFAVAELAQLFAFRRGSTNALISSLSFRPGDCKFLAVATASSPTVHIFKLESAVPSGTSESDDVQRALPPAASAVAVGAVGAAVAVARAAASGIAPGYFAPARSFCQFRLADVDSHGKPLVDLRLAGGAGVAGPLVVFGKNLKLYVLHYNGVLYEADFDEAVLANATDVPFAHTNVVFAARPDFRLENPREEDGAWQVL